MFRSVDESSELETSDMFTDGNSSPIKRDLFGDLNLAESVEEHPHLLEGSESERGKNGRCGFVQKTLMGASVGDRWA